MKDKVEVVQFKCGTYGVRKEEGYNNYVFLGIKDTGWWRTPEFVKRYCQFKNKEDACSGMKDCLIGTVDDLGTPVSCDCDKKWSAEPAVTCYKKPWYKFWSSI